jgi:hypothetical protein
MNDALRKANEDGSYDEWGDRRDYQVVNGWSVVALILAVLSISSLVLPLLLVFSLLAIIISLVALSKVQREPHLFMGRRLAILSLVIAVIVGGWTLSRRYFFNARMFAAAESNVDNWFQLIKEGKQEEAHQLTLLAGMRTSGRMTLQEYYQNEKRVRQEMQTFFSEAPMQQIIKLGENWSARWIANRIIRITDENGLLVFQRFEIHYTQDGRPVTLPVEIKSSRKLDKYTRASHWTVLTVRHLQ